MKKERENLRGGFKFRNSQLLLSLDSFPFPFLSYKYPTNQRQREEEVDSRIDSCIGLTYFFFFYVIFNFIYVTKRRGEFHGGMRASLY